MRPSQAKRGGGGFLNGVDVMFTGYQFELSADQEIKKGKNAGKTWSPISFVPSFRVDGADADVSQRLLLCNADTVDATVSDDGLTVTFGPDALIFADNETMIFLQSLIDSGFPESNFNDDPTVLNVEPAVGCRLKLVQTVNAEKTKQQGKQKGKDGKEYDRKDLKVAEVLSLPQVAAKTNGKTKAVVKGGKAAKGPDVSELAAETLAGILEANDGSIALAKLRMKVFAAFGAKHPQRDQRDAVIAYLTNPDNLEGVDGVEFDGTTIAAA